MHSNALTRQVLEAGYTTPLRMHLPLQDWIVCTSRHLLPIAKREGGVQVAGLEGSVDWHQSFPIWEACNCLLYWWLMLPWVLRVENMVDPPPLVLIPWALGWSPSQELIPTCWRNSPNPCSSLNSEPNRTRHIPFESKKSDLQDGIIYLSICWHLFAMACHAALGSRKLDLQGGIIDLVLVWHLFVIKCYIYMPS